jgi:hypothetical protein
MVGDLVLQKASGCSPAGTDMPHFPDLQLIYLLLSFKDQLHRDRQREVTLHYARMIKKRLLLFTIPKFF